MKKIIVLLMVVLTLAGCATTDTESTNTVSSEESSQLSIESKDFYFDDNVFQLGKSPSGIVSPRQYTIANINGYAVMISCGWSIQMINSEGAFLLYDDLGDINFSEQDINSQYIDGEMGDSIVWIVHDNIQNIDYLVTYRYDMGGTCTAIAPNN